MRSPITVCSAGWRGTSALYGDDRRPRPLHLCTLWPSGTPEGPRSPAPGRPPPEWSGQDSHRRPAWMFSVAPTLGRERHSSRPRSLLPRRHRRPPPPPGSPPPAAAGRPDGGRWAVGPAHSPRGSTARASPIRASSAPRKITEERISRIRRRRGSPSQPRARGVHRHGVPLPAHPGSPAGAGCPGWRSRRTGPDSCGSRSLPGPAGRRPGWAAHCSWPLEQRSRPRRGVPPLI